jgi:hypothetical protein
MRRVHSFNSKPLIGTKRAIQRGCSFVYLWIILLLISWNSRVIKEIKIFNTGRRRLVVVVVVVGNAGKKVHEVAFLISRGVMGRI